MGWRIYSITAKKFYNDNGLLHASALTFYTLFAIVPILAVAFGIAKGFGLESFLNTQIEKSFPGQEKTILLLSQYAQNLLAHSKGGIITGVALIVLLYSVYSMLNHIEKSLNNIWQVSDSRSMNLRISHYLSIILVAPIILIVAGSLKLFIAKKILDYNLILSWSSSIISIVLIVLFFTWLYQDIPNIKVKIKAALFGSIHTGIAYTLLQSFLVESQLFMNNYGTIYGSLSALPIFLIWVHISWIIVLYGAQLCFVKQNNIKEDWELDLNLLSANTRLELAVKIANLCINQFKLDKPPLNENDLSIILKIPPCSIRQLMTTLIAADILTETISQQTKNYSYQPAKNINMLNEQFIISTINNHGITNEGLKCLQAN